MTVEELKTEANKLGYNIIKKPTPKERYLSCICGRNAREHWTGMKSETLTCMGCGLSVSGKPSELRRLWNNKIKELTNENAKKAVD